jgi:Protoglobin
MSIETLAGYTYGTPAVARSPVSLAELALLEASVGWTPADAEALRKAGVILEDQIDAILDTWLSPVRATPFLAAYYGTPDGRTIDERYFIDVRARFGQWIRDTCNRPHDQAWLDYQHEIGLRHHRAKKNRTDGAATTPHIPLRYMISSIAPISLSMKPFLAAKGQASDEVEAMFAAWCKAVALQAALWSRPYANEADF